MKLLALVIVLIAGPAFAQQAGPVKTITENTTLQAGAVINTPLVIKTGGVVIDGNGATLQGPGKAGDIASLAKAGIGIIAEGVSDVTIKNLKVHGFETALVAKDGSGWRIEGCDFSNNYHDPEFGWGDGERNGGIILTRMNKCTIANNKANNVWNGLDLWESNDNTIEKNDFGHCSNVCLKLWTSCRNVITDNNLSYGLRIKPGEVHARDSTSVLIESGSNDNRFERNDITHGGDGVFIRVLNGWCSMGNVFIENDCSYANNNGFEAWSPGNTYLRNKSNHCSYGFWLGGSDNTVLIGNEAAYNGQPDGFHNAPEADFQHGGIVIVGGSGSHTLIDGNYCHHNAGAGIVFRGDVGSKGAKWKMYHLVVQNNRLENNKWGLFARFTDWLDLAGNTFKDNEKEEMFEEVTNVTRREADPEGKPAPKAILLGPSRAVVGEEVNFDASPSTDEGGRKLEYRIDIGGTVVKQAKAKHKFTTPGFYRVGLTVNNGYLAGLAFKDVYVAEAVKEIGTEGEASQWGWRQGDNDDQKGKVIITDDETALVGKASVHFRPDPYKGAEVIVSYPKSKEAKWNLEGKKALTFWIKCQNANQGFQGPNPLVRLHGPKGAFTYTPGYQGIPRNLLGDFPYPEARYGWLYVKIPLAGGDDWLRSETLAGKQPPHVNNGLEFLTVTTPIETQEASGMVSDGKLLYCATTDGDQLLSSPDGQKWKELKSPTADLQCPGGGWINGMLVYYPKGGEKGCLYLRHMDPKKDQFGDEQPKLIAYDIATDKWSWLPTTIAMGHGATIVGDNLYGIAHAIMGNFGGPVCRVNLASPGEMEDRTVLNPVPGKDPAWFSRAAQLAAVDGRIYGIKNDWTTPQPKAASEIGDRLYAFDPADYAPSKFVGGKRWDGANWKAANTPIEDLGPLPFEVGHGASLVALPPSWCDLVGAKGGLFIVAGCSPSNHEGYGQPSNLYAIYDIAKRKFTTGVLPDTTGTGTSAAFHKGKLYIKRGGMNFGPSNRELWIVRPLSADEAKKAESKLTKDRMTLQKVDYVSFQFDSLGFTPFDIWIDGLAFE